MRVVFWLGVVFILAACSASWRAPVESRGSRPVSEPSPPRSTTSPARRAVPTDRYRVKRGDTLYGIAWRTGVDYRSIARWNGLRPPYRIYAGQTLKLKPPASTRKPSTSAPVAANKPARKPPPKVVKKPSPAGQRLGWSWPAKGKIVSRFRSGEPLRSGIRIAGSAGASIRSAEAGKVVYSGSGLIGYGRLIIVKHNDNYLSAYGHNRNLLVAEGDQVTKGQKIAEMGTANNGDPLLHFEIRRDGKPVDPLGLLPRR